MTGGYAGERQIAPSDNVRIAKDRPLVSRLWEIGAVLRRLFQNFDRHLFCAYFMRAASLPRNIRPPRNGIGKTKTSARQYEVTAVHLARR